MATSLATPAASTPHESSSARPSQSHAWLYCWLFPGLGVASLLASCVLWSLKRQMWGDEVFSHVELSDPSFGHLLSAVNRLGGAGMPLFYLTAWPWAHLFGLSDLSLRLYSSTGVCGAFLILLITLRRFVSPSSAFLGAAFGLFASLIVVEQNSEARGYGLFLFLCALAIAQLLKVARTRHPRRRDLVLLALAQAGLVLGHVLGLAYAGLLLLALVVADALQHRIRPRVYAWAVAGWLALVPWIPAIRASAAVGRPHGWIPVPTLADLGSSLSFWLFTGLYWQWQPHPPQAVLLAGWFCAVTVTIVLVFTAAWNFPTASPKQRALCLAGFSLAVAPIALYTVSIVGTPVFLPRYLMPSALGIAILAAAWTDRTRAGKGTRAIILSCAVLCLPIAAALLAHPEGLNVSRVDALAAGRPIVCDSLKDFLVMTRYSATPSSPEYPLDWPTALASPPGTTADVRLMQNYRREGYLTRQLLDPSAILNQPSFLVLNNAESSWFHMAIENNPRFTWKTIARVDATRRVVLVERKFASATSFEGGIAQRTHAPASEFSGRNAQVNAIAPGYLRAEDTRPPQEDETRNGQILEDLAGAAAFLASPAGDYVRGTDLAVDGGWLAR